MDDLKANIERRASINFNTERKLKYLIDLLNDWSTDWLVDYGLKPYVLKENGR